MKWLPRLLKTKNGTLCNICYRYQNVHISDMLGHAKNSSGKIHKKRASALALGMESQGARWAEVREKLLIL